MTTQSIIDEVGASVTQNAWGNTLSSENFYNSKYGELLCEDNYWIASRTVYNSAGMFSMFSISSASGISRGDFYPTCLFQTSGYVGNIGQTKGLSGGNHIMPIVTVPRSNINKIEV